MMEHLGKFQYDAIDVIFRRGTSDEDVLEHSFDKDIFYPAIPEFEASEQAMIIDVGAHIGTFSFLSIANRKATKVFALEPNSESYSILLRNVKANKLEQKIITIPKALSDVSGKEQLYLDAENWNHSLTHVNSDNAEWVETISLSRLFEEFSIDTCDLIKFNCEGSEFKIILSLQAATLSKIKMMLILFHEDLVNGLHRGDLIRYLNEAGFLTRLENESERRGWIIAKNSKHYSLLNHRIAVLKGRLSKGTKQFVTNLMNGVRKTPILLYAKSKIKKSR